MTLFILSNIFFVKNRAHFSQSKIVYLQMVSWLAHGADAKLRVLWKDLLVALFNIVLKGSPEF